MAAALGQSILAEMKVPAMVISAGTLGIFGSPASEHSVSVLEEMGVSLSGHRSQGLSAALMRAADKIVVMAPEHEEWISEKDPTLEHKIVRLWEHAEPKGRLSEIADPIGRDRATYLRCRDDIAACLRAWARTLA